MSIFQSGLNFHGPYSGEPCQKTVSVRFSCSKRDFGIFETLRTYRIHFSRGKFFSTPSWRPFWIFKMAACYLNIVTLMCHYMDDLISKMYSKLERKNFVSFSKVFVTFHMAAILKSNMATIILTKLCISLVLVDYMPQ